jgi:hypothetical protein
MIPKFSMKILRKKSIGKIDKNKDSGEDLIMRNKM